MFDQNPKTGWGLPRKRRGKRVLTLGLAQPFVANHDCILKVVIRCGSKGNLGNFRLLATATGDSGLLKSPPYVPPPETYVKYVNLGWTDKLTEQKGEWEPGKPFTTGSHGYAMFPQGVSLKPNRNNVNEMKRAEGNILRHTAMENIKAMRFTVPSGNRFNVALYFQENWKNKVGERVFSVSIEGTRVLRNVDLMKVGKHKQFIWKTRRPVLVKDGVLDIEFTPLTGKRTLLNAIVIQSYGKLKYPEE